jgi:hypothetical protein
VGLNDEGWKMKPWNRLNIDEQIAVDLAITAEMRKNKYGDYSLAYKERREDFEYAKKKGYTIEVSE